MQRGFEHRRVNDPRGQDLLGLLSGFQLHQPTPSGGGDMNDAVHLPHLLADLCQRRSDVGKLRRTEHPHLRSKGFDRLQLLDFVAGLIVGTR